LAGSRVRVETVHDAINAMRNYRMESDIVGGMLSAFRQTEIFQSDEYQYLKGGGWQVEGWSKPFIARGYTVTFNYFVIVSCEVYDCGAIDIPNCLTFNGNTPVPSDRTWVTPTTG
jgi:hypothetical protein